MNNFINGKMIYMIIKGKPIDEKTRCIHYHSEEDVIAIKFKCCNEYYPCFYCHEETAGHVHSVWEKDAFNCNAVLCGNCKTELTITEYKNCHYRCPYCNTQFNPKCSKHDHFYFETD